MTHAQLKLLAAGALLGALAACSGSDDAEVTPAAPRTADCVQPAPPAVPNGATASFDEMSTAARTVAEYLFDAERYQACLENGGDFNRANVAEQERLAVEAQFEQSKTAFQQRR